jgi:predicted homoserine dehydrogenase-like protein
MRYSIPNAPPERVVRAVVLGAGSFGAGIVAQAAHVSNLKVCAVADSNLDTARRAFGDLPAEQICTCQSVAQTRAAIESGRYVATTDASILFDQPIDVIVEATGSPEAGARHAQAAIAQGKHVAMVTKETDAAIGPILKYLADRAGVVYTAVDGDQHGLLISLVRWARSVGLEIECAGKALDAELILDAPAKKMTRYGHPLEIEHLARFAHHPRADSRRLIQSRSEALGEFDGSKPWDLVELTIAANATGLSPDIPQTHSPAAWTTEIPSLLCGQQFGGLLSQGGAIDAVQVIRSPHEAGMGGGVFVVVRITDESMRHILQSKGAICHPDGATAMIVHPYHLLGIEAIHSILSAGLFGIATGAREYLPRFDVVYRATQPLRAGTNVGHDHSPELSAEIVPAHALTPTAPLPCGLAQGARLLRDVPAGALISRQMVEPPGNSTLWSLRRLQDAHFSCPLFDSQAVPR